MASPLFPDPEIGRNKVGKNRRNFARYRCAPATSGKVYLGDNAKSLHAWVVNLSEGGLALLLDVSLELGFLFTIQMKNTVSDKLIQLFAHVVHCTQLDESQWLLGCKLDVPLSKEQLDELL